MSTRNATYLDANAGAPLHRKVGAKLAEFFLNAEFLGNPSSIHLAGRTARKRIAESRETIARSFGADTKPDELMFSSSGTEANQQVIRSVLTQSLQTKGQAHWITTPVEHDSVLRMVKWFRDLGGEVSYLPLDEFGAPITSAFEELVTSNTALVSCIWVNNETGVMADVSRLARVARKRGIILHIDGAQAWGKLPFNLPSLGADFVTFAAHKIGALAGTGITWVREASPLSSRRGGTENIVGIMAAGIAAGELDPTGWASEIAPVRDQLESLILDRLPCARINGAGARRVANTTNVSFSGIEGEGLVMNLDLAGYCVSAGSACSSGALEPSHVLLAMGRSREESLTAIRISLYEPLPLEEVEGFVDTLARTVLRMQKTAIQ